MAKTVMGWATDGREQRQYPRFQAFASVELRHEKLTLCLTLRNVSLGGAFLEMPPELTIKLPPGSEHEVLAFVADEPSIASLRASVRVIRHDTDGLAVEWLRSAESAGPVEEFVTRITQG